MNLGDYLSIKELNECVIDGLVSVRDHNEFPIRIYNYTPKAQFTYGTDWPDTVAKCRGLVVDDQNEIIAFGQPKFHNLDPEKHADVVRDSGDPVIFDKSDGSLGLVFKYNDTIQVATRGSFHSEQAEWANAFLAEHPEYLSKFRALINLGYTPHVEIIYNQNRIVVDYDYEDLVFLGAQNQLCWYFPIEFDRLVYPGRVVQQFDISDWQDLPKRDNSEGYVLFYPKTEQKFKIKNDWYLELHRAIFGFSRNKVKQQYIEGTAEQFIQQLPDEFHAEANQILTDLKHQEFDIWFDSIWNMAEIGTCSDRKEFAEKARTYPNPALLFMHYDGRSDADVRSVIRKKMLK